MVVLLDPAHFTCEVGTNPPPLTVKVNPWLPRKADAGDMLVIITDVLEVIIKVTAPEVPPPGVGLNTVILKLPVATRSEAGITAVT